MIFSSWRFFQKTNEWIRLYYILCDLFLFVFWKKLKIPKRHFEINWPLGTVYWTIFHNKIGPDMTTFMCLKIHTYLELRYGPATAYFPRYSLLDNISQHDRPRHDYFHMLAEFQATQHNGVKLFLIEHCYFSLAFSQDFFFFNMNSYFISFLWKCR